MLSHHDAESFLNNVLKFPNWKDVLERDKLEFLKQLVPYYAHRLPYHNVFMASTPTPERHVITEQEVIHDCLNGLGGACVTENPFLTMLLQALKFNAYMVPSFVHGPGNIPDNHVICAVELSPGEKYILDLGVALPFEKPVPMHSLPLTQIAGGLRYKYRPAEDRDGVFYRVQMDGSLYGEKYQDENFEFVRHEFTMTPQPFSFFTASLDKLFKDVNYSIFLRYPYLFRYFEEDSSGNLVEKPSTVGSRSWIIVRGLSVLIGTNKTRLVKHYQTYDEVKPVIFKYFPELPKEKVEAAFKTWNDSVPQFGYFKAK